MFNAALSNSSAINYSANPTRRIDFAFDVGYEDSIERVKGILKALAISHPLVLEEPPPQVVLGEHGDSSIVFYLRMWCKREDYWSIYFEMLEKVKIAFNSEGINIPYPQHDVHIVGNNKQTERRE